MDIGPQIIAQNRYVLTAPAADFAAATQALASRVRSAGHPGILSYRFFTHGTTGAANVIYADAAAWIGHHDIVMGWSEMAALRAVSRLEQVTLLGPVTPGIRDWIVQHGLTVPIVEISEFTAGFRR